MAIGPRRLGVRESLSGSITPSGEVAEGLNDAATSPHQCRSMKPANVIGLR